MLKPYEHNIVDNYRRMIKDKYPDKELKCNDEDIILIHNELSADTDEVLQAIIEEYT